jgi:hypothetical protein
MATSRSGVKWNIFSCIPAGSFFAIKAFEQYLQLKLQLLVPMVRQLLPGYA